MSARTNKIQDVCPQVCAAAISARQTIVPGRRAGRDACAGIARRGVRGSLLLLLLEATACHSTPRIKTPQDAAQAWRVAIERGDAELAWSLLSPGLQAQLGHEGFVAAFEASREQLKNDLAGSNADSPGEKRSGKGSAKRERGPSKTGHVTELRTATTVHEGGQWLTWVEVDGQYLVASGLPGLPDLSTPERAIRAFIAAARSQDRTGMDQVLADELVEINQEQLEARLEAIEAALSSEGLERAEDGTRASLLYGSGRRLVLQLRDGQWRVVGFK